MKKGFILKAALLFELAIVALRGWQQTGPQLIAMGRLDQALAVYRTAADSNPKSLAANNGTGVVLDLLGRYSDARPYFAAAIKAARTPLEKALAERSMAIAHGFSGDSKGAEKFEASALDFYLSTSDFYNAGEVADEMGRLSLDSGDLDRALEWYRKGYEAGLSEPDISPAHKDLWAFRLAHAKARIAARRGKPEEARKFAAQARSILERGRIPEQEEYLPYLTGYVAFYAGDYPAALPALQQASRADPFIQCLTAQTYEAMGNREKAMEYYQRAANTTAHSVPAAYARPFATKKLQYLAAALPVPRRPGPEQFQRIGSRGACVRLVRACGVRDPSSGVLQQRVVRR